MEDTELQARFRAMADSAPVLLWTTGPDGACTFLNRRWLQFTGRGLDEQLGDGWLRSVHPDDADRATGGLRRAIRRREPFEMECRLRRADGTWRWIRMRGTPVFPGDAFAGFAGSGTDLTDRRDAEEALAASREQLAGAMAAGRMGSFDVDLTTGRVVRDPNLEELYGLRQGQAGTFDEWALLIHPDDQGTVLDEVARASAEGGSYHLEHRLIRPDGEVRWFERRGHAYTDAGGTVVGIRGVVIDVTDRKAAEHERAVLFERVSRLQEITAALARAGTPAEVLDTMVGEGLAALLASAGSVALLEAHDQGLDVARARGYDRDLLEEFRHIDLGAPVPLADAARTGAPVICRDLGEVARRYPDLAARVLSGGHTAVAAFPLVVDERVIGAVGLSFKEPQPFDPAQREFVSAVVAQCAQALDRTRSYAAEAAAREAAEAAQARLALIAEASSVVAGSMEYETTLPEVARLAIPLLGDCCVIDLFEDGEGGWRRVAAVHLDPRAADKLLSVPPEAWTAADTAHGAATLADLDLCSALVVPLEARGRALGMLAFGRRERGAFSDADRNLAAGLATRVAQAIDNALLYRAERHAHQDAETAAGRLRFLLEITTALAAPGDRDDRLERLAQQAAGAICDLCLIDLLERDGSLRRVAAAAGNPSLRHEADALRQLLHPHPGNGHPSVAAIRTGRTELCSEITDSRLRTIATSDAHLEVARRIAPLSYVAVPLVGEGPVLGAICLITTTVSGRRYGPADMLLAEDMAKRVAMGIESAAMHEEMRRVAQTLQASLLPSVPPAIPGLEVGTRYVAAEAGAVVGGDFFDVFALGPASWAVVVGDVCGRGVEAATVTGLARHTIRSSALGHDSPTTVISHLNDVLLRVAAETSAEADPRFCTVGLARVVVTDFGASVTLALGGHPRPYVLGADGSVRQVGRPGSLLGVMEHATAADEDMELGPGEALVLYTDGVTERHQGGRFFDDHGLEATLSAAAGLTAEEIAGRIEEAARHFASHQPADDMAVVVVRVPPR